MKRRLWNKITAFCIILFLACLGIASALCFSYGKNAVNSNTVSTEAVGISSTIASYDGETSDSDAAAYYKTLSNSAYTAAMTTETETDTTDYGEINYFCISDDLISDGEFLEHRLENLPEGIVFDYDNKTLYLTDVTTDSSILIEGGYLTIIVSGECNINHLWINYAKVEIIGGGNLNIGSFESDGAISMPDGSSLTITDGVTVTAKGRCGSVSCGSSEGINNYLTVTGGATLNSWTVSLEGEDCNALWFGNGTLLVENGTINTHKIYTAGTNANIVIGNNGVFNVIAQDYDFIYGDTMSMFLNDGASLIIDGGTFNFDRTNVPETYTLGYVYVGSADSSIILKSGSFNTYPLLDRYAIDLNCGGNFTQTGGELNISNVYLGGNYNFLGGVANLNGGGDIMGGSVIVNGGIVNCNLYDNDTNGCVLNINSGTTLCVLSGELNINNDSSNADTIWCDAVSYILFIGGTTTINTASGELIYYASYGSHITIGSGLYFLDGNGNELTINLKSVSVKTSTGKATISGNGGEFSSAMSITSSNITVGTSFTVMHAVSLGVTEGTASFVLPDGMVFTENSLTVNSEVADYYYNGNMVTVNLSGNGSAVIRFSATVTAAGDYTIQATANANGTEYSDSCTFTAKAFTISITTQTSRTSIPVSGTAAANSTITFYNKNNIIIGKTTATSLGNWSTNVEINYVGENSLYAVITLPSGEKITSDTYVVIYDPDCEEVSTLTMTNVYHGQTSVDPDITGVLVIDYINGTSSASYYTYDPSHPTFEYEVAFTKNADKVGNVYVITTDSYGNETVCKLTYDSESGTWKGSCDYTELTAPCYFQVAWESPEDDGTTEDDTTDGETDDGDTDETVDNSDGLYISTDDTNFTFAVYDVNYLTLCDTAGEEMEFYYQYSESNGWYVVSSDFSAGLLYTAKLSSGTFPEYEDYNTLYIVIEGSTGVSGYYEYNDGVIEVDTLGSITDYSVGDVIVVANSEAYVVTENGFENAGIEDVYKELYVTQDDIPYSEMTLSFDEAAVVEAYKNSEAYSRLARAIEISADGISVSASYELDDAEIELEVKYHPHDEDKYAEIEMNVTVSVDVTVKGKTFTIKVSEGYIIKVQLSLLIEVHNSKYETMYQSAVLEYGLTRSISVYKDTEEDVDDILTKYFTQEISESILEALENPQEKSATLTLFELYSISYYGVTEQVRIDFNFDYAASGELTSTQTVAYTVSGGYHALYDGTELQIETFSSKPVVSVTSSITLHVAAEVGVNLKVYCGVGLLTILNTSLYESVGLVLEFEGHGTVSATYDTAQGFSTAADAELSVSLLWKVEIGVNLEFRLSRFYRVAKDYPIITIKQTLWEAGFKYMPTEFEVVEEEVIYITDGSDLTELIDLALVVLDFSNDLLGNGTSYPIVTKTFDIDSYTFEVVGGSGINITKEGIVQSYFEDSFEVKVKITYTGSTEKLQLYKVVNLCYTAATITVHKDIDGASKVAMFTVTDKDTGVMLGYLFTNENGVGTYPVEVDKTYIVTEVSCADGYIALVDTQVIESNGSATFYNVKKKKIRYSSKPKKDLVRDPSGYVYEGSEDFRLSGVTATIYYSVNGPDENGNVTDAVIWNAEDYDQQNPLTTNASGEYMWNVPDGWWQVVYEKDGYETAYSDWMTVPPTRTGVNVNLITYAEAELSLVSVDGNMFTFKFNHPVTASSLYNGFAVEYGGEILNGTIEFIDCGLSDDNILLVMSFSFTVNGDWYESAAATVRYSVTTYSGIECSGTLDLEISATMQTVKISYVTVDGATLAEYEVTVSVDSLDWMLWYYGYLYLPEGYDYTEYNYNNGDLVVTIEEIVTEPVDPEEPEDPVEPDDPETPDDPVTDDPDDPIDTEDPETPDDPVDTEDPETPDDTGNDDDIQEPADSGSSDETGSAKWVIAVAVVVVAVVVICGAVIFVIRKKKK